MRAAYILVTGPAQEPITIAEAKLQARISDDASNTLLRSYIQTARQAAEDTLGYGLFTQTWKLELSAFAEIIPLPMALQLQNDSGASPSTAVVVTYYDPNGVLQTLATSQYLVDTTSRPARITRAPATAWPPLQMDRLTGVVIITYVVGWTTVAAIPERIKQGIRSYVTYLDLDRDGMEAGATNARASAEACWVDTVSWCPPHSDRYHLVP